MIDLGGKRIVDTATHRYNYALMACTVEQANAIIDEVANGRSIKSVCNERDIQRWAFYELLSTNGELIDRLARAQAIRDDATEDEILEIADEDTEQHARQRNRLEARYKILAARRPQRWGAKLDLQLTNKGDARQAEQRADARLLRYQSNGLLPHVIDVVGETLGRPADKQSAGLAIGPPDKDIFA